QDPEGDKWRSDKIIFGERYHLWDDFTKWFDSERWNWENGSVVLARCFNCHIDKWWDPEKFNWEYGSPYLAGYCYRYFSKWWDPEKFNWEDGSYCLARYCSDYFTKWWDPEKFDWAEKCFLETYCQQYKEIWGNNKY
ncbi:MAG: hypothetical protein QXO70_00585, partial [Candidatus Pacearchaeota archaeon]